MILGSVPEDHGVLPPCSALLAQLSDKVSDEESDDCGVCVALTQSNVAFTIVIEGQDHRDSGLPQLLWLGGRCTRGAPLLPSEVLHPKPGLIYIDDSGLLGRQLQILDCPLLPQHQVPC